MIIVIQDFCFSLFQIFGKGKVFLRITSHREQVHTMPDQSIQPGYGLPGGRYANYDIRLTSQTVEKNFKAGHKCGYQRTAGHSTHFFNGRDQYRVQWKVEAMAFISPLFWS